MQIRNRLSPGLFLACTLLCACGGGGGGTPPTPGTSATPAGPTGSQLLSRIVITLSAPLVIGSPSTTSRVEVMPYDKSGNPISGNLPAPITVTDLDKSGHTTISGSTSITSTAQWLPITYDGKGDHFAISASMGNFTATQPFITTLEKEQVLSGLSQVGLNYFGQPTLGPDGNFWVAYSTSLYKLTAAGQITQYTDSNGQIAYQGGAPIALDGNGNLWTAGWDGYIESGGLSRVTTSGAFTDFPFTGTFKQSSSSAAQMVTGPDGAVWFTVGSPDVGLPGIGIGRVDTSGNITQVVQLPDAPTNLIVGPDGNFWFAEDSYVDKMTPAGAITQYTLPGAGGSIAQLHFIVGPDGNFWAPFPYGQQLLLKFNVNGSVVSSTPLSYAPDWFPHQGQAMAPFMHTLVSDATRYVYFTDDSAQTVLRVDGSGNLTAYPTYSTMTNIVDNPLYIVRDASGTLYLASTAVLGWTQAEMQQGFTPLDTSLW